MHLIQDPNQSKFRQYLPIGLIVGFILLFFIVARLSSNRKGPPIVSGVLDSESFPVEEISYPDNWPMHSVLPTNFMLVSTSSGTLPIADTAGWVSKFRFQGTAADAFEEVSQHFESLGWAIEDSAIIEFSGSMAIIINPDVGSGFILVESDSSNSQQVVISISIYQ